VSNKATTTPSSNQSAYYGAVGFEMMAMYQVHNIDKVPYIPQLIQEWEGKEVELITAVREKYCRYNSVGSTCVDCHAHSKTGYGKVAAFQLHRSGLTLASSFSTVEH
tara:strand:- start:391 stop:711 length:321 start_codon:yes stop_codon:yes gene_type:complete